ncbi:MAG: N-acetylmuramic acid 6-phosphate etherase [Alphaproteobacteria bacterium]|nr:N-acetylmuramic acid 6-phosphate etherase [Alphaproteobacteria bacterium]
MIISTEKNNPQTGDIDLANGQKIAELINAEDLKVAVAIQKILPQIGDAIEKIAHRMKQGGRMAYFGSGTSGRIGVLDASEMPPTFGVSPSLVQGYISGGDKALRCAVENAEDRADLAEQDFADFNAKPEDIVVSISASGNPQYGVKVLELARQKKCLTIAITSNPNAALKMFADIFLCTEVGPEVLTGSSRMKAGTAQKMILNMLSTGAMIKLGKAYHNYMIDLQINNTKLYERANRFVQEITGADEQTAKKALDKAKHVATACVMIAKNCDKEAAQELLRQNGGVLRKIIK